MDAQGQDTTWERMLDRQEKDLVNSIDNLMLDEDKATPADTLAPQLDMTEKEHEVEGTKDEDKTQMYNMTEQEQRLQCEEERLNIYMSTFGYEGNDSDLDSNTDLDLNAMAYPFLELKNIRKSETPFPPKEEHTFI